jgi:hypothetical protein
MNRMNYWNTRKKTILTKKTNDELNDISEQEEEENFNVNEFNVNDGLVQENGEMEEVVYKNSNNLNNMDDEDKDDFDDDDLKDPDYIESSKTIRESCWILQNTRNIWKIF